MADYGQNRSASITGPGDMQGLMLTRLTAIEQISRPFQIDLELCGMEGASSRGAADPDGILGKPASVALKVSSSYTRYFHGIVTEFAHTGCNERLHEYRAVLRPAFWLLTRRADCRVLQNMSTPDIFKEVCRQAGFDDHQLNLSGSYDPWEYRVQYRESDFDFLSRLLEHEGIYYYFEHASDRHVMVLTDDVAKLSSEAGYDTVPYYPPGDHQQRERDHLSSWISAKTFQPAAFAAREYNFETPASVPSGVSPVAGRSDANRFEIFDYPAGANQLTAAGVERMAKLRAEQMQSSQIVIRSSGDAAGLYAGKLFALKGHPRDDFNGTQYLITSSKCTVSSDEARTGATAISDELQFAVSIEAIDGQEPFRPARVTPKPLIQGLQTARVVGTSGEDITTDKYGRVKVQFHWDRAGTSNEESSCWVRVAQSWAGKNWGAQFVPRVGQEVVVSFLEGDPDHPLIIGSVYNADQMPPYELPANQTQSGVKTRSSKDGTAENFNEIRFEDKKDAEEIYIHAERDLRLVVENNQIVTVGAEKKEDGDRTTTIHNNDTLTVGGDLEVKVTGKETRTVTEDRVTTLEANDKADVSQKYSLKAGQEITLEVGQSKLVMKSDGTIEISGMQLKLSGTSKVEIDGTQTAISGSQLEVKGSMTKVEGSGQLDLNAGGIASLKGSITKIG